MCILGLQCTALSYIVNKRLLYFEVPIVKGKVENTNNNIIIIFIQDKIIIHFLLFSFILQKKHIYQPCIIR